MYAKISTYGRPVESRYLAGVGKRHSDGNNFPCHREAASDGKFLPAIPRWHSISPAQALLEITVVGRARGDFEGFGKGA